MAEFAKAAVVSLDVALSRNSSDVDAQREVRESRYELNKMEPLRAEADLQARSISHDIPYSIS